MADNGIVAATKENQIRDYIVDLFSGGITSVVDNGSNSYTLTITFNEANFYNDSGLPTLRTGDRITIYDTLTYDPDATQVYFQPQITSVDSATEITIYSEVVPLDSYSWRLLSGFVVDENPEIFHQLKSIGEPKSSLPIVVVQLQAEYSSDVDKYDTCIDAFGGFYDIVEWVQNRLSDSELSSGYKWTADAAQDSKLCCDSVSLIIDKNLKIQNIVDNRYLQSIRYRTGDYSAGKECHVKRRYFKIQHNHLKVFN